MKLEWLVITVVGMYVLYFSSKNSSWFKNNWRVRRVTEGLGGWGKARGYYLVSGGALIILGVLKAFNFF
ncbi:hypothetical protein HY214_00165 [Candidatus Roizmanbacteria bacterium]|nr:hypothetical protein [Candidatus Roizmanbacteria bacterium]